MKCVRERRERVCVPSERWRDTEGKRERERRCGGGGEGKEGKGLGKDVEEVFLERSSEVVVCGILVTAAGGGACGGYSEV